MSHPVKNREWVTLLYFFARQSHQSCLTVPWPTAKSSEWCCFISLPGSFITIMSHPMTNRKWAVTLLYFFARQSHQSCLIPWLTASELLWPLLWQAVSSIMSHPMTTRKWVTLLYFFASQAVSSIMSHIMTNRMWVTLLLFLCQAASSIMPHSMTNSKWVILLHFFARQSHKSCLIPWPTGGECHTLLCFFSRQSHQPCIIPWPSGSEWHLCLCQAVSSIISHIPWPTVCEWHCLFLCHIISHMTDREWVTLHCFFARQSQINYISSHDQQQVSDTILLLCQAVLSVTMSHHMTNRMWAQTLLYFFAMHHFSSSD